MTPDTDKALVERLRTLGVRVMHEPAANAMLDAASRLEALTTPPSLPDAVAGDAVREAFERMIRKPYADDFDAVPWHILERSETDARFYRYDETRRRWNDFQAGADGRALATPVPEVAGEGWIVGSGDGERWRCWRDGFSDWTIDRDAATRYARREDAEAVHREDEDAWTVQPYAALSAQPEASAPAPMAADHVREALAERMLASLMAGQCGVPRGHMDYNSECICGDKEAAEALTVLGLAYTSNHWPMAGIFLTGIGDSLKERMNDPAFVKSLTASRG